MAKQTIQITKCDVCNLEGAKSFVLAEGSEQAVSSGRALDLCSTHAAPLVELLRSGRRVDVTLEAGSSAPIRQRRAQPTRPSLQIYTEQELDALELEESRRK